MDKEKQDKVKESEDDYQNEDIPEVTETTILLKSGYMKKKD